MIRTSIYLRADKVRTDGLAPLVVLARLGKDSKRLPLNIFLKIEDWDKNAQVVKNKHLHANAYNAIVQAAKAKCSDIIVKYQYLNKLLDLEKFASEFEGKGNREDFLLFWEKEMYEQFVRKKFASGALAIHKCNLGKLKEYLLSRNESTLLFSEISVQFFADFDLHLVQDMKKKQVKGDAARRKCQKSVKKFLALAAEKGYVFENPFPKGSAIRENPKDRVYLCFEDFKKMLALHRSENILLTHTYRIVLLNFLFSCVTGLRDCDLRLLDASNIVNSELVVKPQKTTETTGKTVKILITPIIKELIDFAKKIDNKYKKFGNTIRLLPQVANATENRILKQLAKMAGVNKSLTMHAGRHTFATVFLERGGSIQILMELLGHSKINTTMIYTHIVDKSRQTQMQNVWAEI